MVGLVSLGHGVTRFLYGRIGYCHIRHTCKLGCGIVNIRHIATGCYLHSYKTADPTCRNCLRYMLDLLRSFGSASQFNIAYLAVFMDGRYAAIRFPNVQTIAEHGSGVEEQGWSAFHDLVAYFGWGWALILVAAFLVLSRLDIIRRLFVERQKTENEEREQLSEDVQRLIENLRGDADRQRQWRIDESTRYESRIASLEERNSKLVEIIASSERGNSRLRHTVNNLCQWASSVRTRALRAGVPVTPFNLSDMMELDPELAAKMKSIFDEADMMAPPMIEDKSD